MSEPEQTAWEEFQNSVAHLFAVAGFDVKQNILINHKKADVFVSERRYGKSHRIVVECKDYAKPLTQSEVSEIYANYLPLFPTHVDEILIVSRKGVSDSAKAMIAVSPHLREVSYHELFANIMDFRPYLTSLVEQFREAGLNRYYVPLRSRIGDDMDRSVEDWLQSSTGRPIAILGSYGLGKTTFARFLAQKYATRALNNPNDRIPILVPLGEISNEQSLEGLLGKLFTATNVVRNYNFSMFSELNRLGHFIILYDGFDEMKQSLSWNDFKFNLKELNRLVSANSRVIILGRPTAFLTDAEHNFALHGVRFGTTYETRDIEWPDFEEIEVSGFDHSQMSDFLRGYLAYLIEVTTRDDQKERLKKFIGFDIDKLVKGQIGDIAKRPVQLKMIIEILPDFHGKLNELTVHGLYDYFVDYVIERESYKLARKRFTTRQRRAFARDVAWWLWRSRDRSILDQALPIDLLRPFMRDDEDSEAVARDLISACVLDRRVGGRLFFPHRSIQEFLVAEAIYDGIVQHRIETADVCAALTPEVEDFLGEFVDKKFLTAMASRLHQHRGGVSLSLLKLVYKNGHYHDFFDDLNKWTGMLEALAVAAGVEDPRKYSKKVSTASKRVADTTSMLLLLLCALIASRVGRDLGPKFASRIVGDVLDAICRLISDLARQRAHGRRVGADIVPIAPLVEVLKGITPSKGDIVISSSVYKILQTELQGYCYVNDWAGERALKYSDAGLPDRIERWRLDFFDDARAAIAAYNRIANR